MKTGPAEVNAALDEWIRGTTDPRLRPLRGQGQAFAESAVGAARSLERRCEDLILRTKRDMFGLGDARRNRAGMALIRICRETSFACQEFCKLQSEDTPLSKLDTGLARLCRSVATSYNGSGRLAATFYRSETGWLSSEIASLQHLNNQVSRFQAKTREVMVSHEQIREQATLLGQHLEALERLIASRAQLEGQIQETSLRMRSLQDAISDAGRSPEITSLDAVEAELRGLRTKLLEKEMSRLGGLITRFLTLLQRGEADHPREAIDVLSRYLETPLTSLARERDGYPRLRDALAGLLRTVESGKLSLNEKKARKALERARHVVGGSLLSLQREARQTFKARAELLRSETVRRIRARRIELRGEYAKFVESRKLLESRTARTAEEIASTQGQVVTRLDRIEKLTSDWFGRKVPQALRDRVLLASQG